MAVGSINFDADFIKLKVKSDMRWKKFMLFQSMLHGILYGSEDV
jgi:hypothetical protein